jgi:hypothetical protein
MTSLRRSGLRWFVSLLAVAALLAGLMREASGAIVVRNSAGTQSPANGSVSSLTWGHTIAAGSERLLVVRVANIDASVTVTNVTYGGVVLTALHSAASGAGPSHVRASVWYLVAPAVSTANVVVTLSASTRVQGYSTDLTGVSQTTPFGTVATATGTNNAVSVTAAGASGDLMFDTAAAQGGAGTATAGASQSPISGNTGPTASDVLGMGSTKAGAPSVTLSWSMTASSPWVSIGVAIKQAVGFTVSGTVFEDVNYGGGAGRTLAASSGVGVNGATVELYNSAGTYMSSTTTAGGGTYSFASLAAGTYHVRVVNSTVPSQRSGTTGTLRGVMTYRSNASSGSAAAVTDFVGGTNPALVDPGAGSSGATFNTGTGVFSAVLSGTAQSFSVVTVGSANIGSVDFGFNFDTVVNTNDSGQGSLRQAITNANTLGGDGSLAQSGRTAAIENLVFMLPNGTAAAGLRSSLNAFSGGVASIAPLSALPGISTPMVINAQAQPGWVAAPTLDLNGGGAGAGTSGLTLSSAQGSTVRGLVIRNFGSNGINITAGSGHVVAGNYIGLNTAGTAAAPNGGQGVNIFASGSNTVGGTAASDRNVISGNGGNSSNGVTITGGGATGNLVRGNYIGTNAAGTASVPNGSQGIYIGSSGNTVGGAVAGAGNVISGNTYQNMMLDTGASGSTVQGNFIGLNAAGDAALVNGWHGLQVLSANNTIGGITAAARNVVSGNASAGIILEGASATGNVVTGNYIGTNAAGTGDINGTGQSSGASGVVIYSGASGNRIGTNADGSNDAAERNVISGNNWYGVELIGTGTTNNVVQGNYIGTTASGLAALGNSLGGVSFWNGASGNQVGSGLAGAGNVISGNGTGVQIANGVTNNKLQGNLIGLGADGSAALANSGVGVYFSNGSTTATVSGNLIGTDANGVNDAGERNVISANFRGVAGQNAEVTGNTIAGNYIGTDATGTLARGNVSSGVYFDTGANGNTVGGTAAGAGNLIAFNGAEGVRVTGANTTGNRIARNAIHSNTGLGIDIAGAGQTPNNGSKSNTLGNADMDSPVIGTALLSGGNLTLSGYVGSAAGQATFGSATVEVFKALADSSGFGQGQTYLGSLTADASGNFSGTLAVSGVTTADGVTATATDSTNNTSEFGANASLGLPVSGTVFEDLNYGGGAGRSLAASGGAGVAGARVELYDNSGAFVSATTTAAGGAYTFTGVATGAYTVRVVNATVLSTRTGASASQVGVMTYRTEAASGAAVAVTDHVGGLDPASADAAAGAGGTTLWTLCAAENANCAFAGTRIVRYGAYAAGSSRWTTRVLTGGTACNNGVFGDPYNGIGKNCYLLNASYQSVANVAVGSAAVTGIDFGFNFSTVVNTNDSGQGSLRQFIANANALGGKAALAQSGNRRNLSNVAQALPAATETSIFMIPGGGAVGGLRSTVPSQLTSGVAQITLTSTLPSIAAASVSLDGSTQTANIGDTNAGWLGTGGTVGTDALSLSQVAKPEVELTFASLAGGVAIAANNVTVRALALRATGASPLANGAIALANDVTGAVIEGNAIGTRATALTDPGAGQYIAVGVISNGADTSTVRNNLIAYFTTTGVQLTGTLSATWTISGNEIRDGGLDFNNADGIALTSATAVTISGNRITGISTQGIVFGAGAGSGTQILNNTLTGNGVGPLTGPTGQSNVVVARSGAVGVRVEANVIHANYGAGIAINSGATGIALTRNLVYANGSIVSRNGSAASGQIDIDLNSASDDTNLGTAPFVTPNDTGDPDAGGNNLQNHPVLASAVISGGTQLIVSGTLDTNANGFYRIEFFGNTSPNASGNGGGQSYLGFANVATNGSGNASFSATLTATVAMGSYVTATATKSDAAYAALSDTSEFSPNVQAGLSLQGTVFEDINYGGGAGRTRAASGGVGVDGARVELYDSAGAFVSATTTVGGGTYRFDVPATGAYLLRVVSGSVPSSRTGYVAGLLGVLTYRGNASSGAVLPVTDFVGGTNPALVDPGNAASGTVLNTSTYVFSAGLTGTAQAVAPITVSGSSIAGVDFGFNFGTVVNTNDTGQGSLRQAITNANALGGDASLAQSGRTAAIENLVFMIGNGTAAPGLRTANNLFTTSAGSYNVATISPTSALPIVTAALVIDAQTQPGWTLNPIVELNGASAGSNGGLRFNVSGNVVRGLVINRFTGDGINIVGGGSMVAGNWIGLNAAGTAASANTIWGIEVNSSGNTIGGSTAAARNVISGNGDNGVYVRSGSNNVVQGNYVGTNAAGSAAVANGTTGVMVHSSTSNNTIGGSGAGQGNLISGNGGAGVRLRSGSGGNTLRGNVIGLNAAGSAALPNAIGIQIDAAGNNNPIGGTGSGDGNVIAGNTGNGIAVWGSPASQGNAILGNSIHSNGAIGIDLGTSAGTSGNGITANTGSKTNGEPNLLMNHPVFTSARARGSQLTVAGYIGTAAGQSAFAGSRVEVFISDSTSANGSGRNLLGAVTADASGNFSGTVTMPYNALRAGSVLTGTATDTANNTSEFGANFSGLVVDWLINHNGDGVDANPGDGLCETSTPGQCTLRAAIMEANARGGAILAAFSLPNCPGAGCIITPASALPAVTMALTIDGQTQPGWALAPLVDLRGEGAGASSNGLSITGAGAIVRGLAVGGFLQSGIVVNANNVAVEGNHVGVGPDGVTARANGANNSATGGVYVAGGTGVVIGGTTASKRNVLSGNGGAGLWANGGTATIIGNYVGTNAAGAAGLGNGRWGVYLAAGTGHKVGGSGAGDGNVISGNSANQKGGVYLLGSGYTIQGNTIGMNAARTAAVPNGDGSTNNAAGIDARSGSGHLIGGTDAGEGNLIAGNLGHGVRVQSQATRILGNSIYNNLWLGIDLNADGVTANNGTQSPSLPNNDMDHPVITSAGYDPGTRALTLTGYVGTGTGQALFAGARIELFTSDGDATGYGEGSAFVGTLTADANGRFSGTVVVPVAVTFSVGAPLTGTATDTSNNTSEFGPNYVTTTMSALAPSRFNAFETSTLANVLTGAIQTRVAGVAASIALIAIDNTGTALQTAFAGTVTLEWMNAADNSGALDAGNCRATWVAAGSAGSASFVSGDQGRISTMLTPAAVGREWRLRISYAGPGGTVTSCATDPFAVRPASLAITGVSDSNDTTAGTTRALDNLAASGGRVHHAGRPFSLRAAARDAASVVTAGYSGTPTIAITGCVLPAGCTAGTLSAPALAASSGLIAADTLSYSEVGAINLQLTDDTFADIDIADTPLLQRRLQSSAVGVGRFVPDRYLLTVGTSPQFATQQGACAAAGQGFTYVGQTFGWATTPSFTVTAQNAAGGPTALWSGALQKLTTAHIARSLAAANAQGLAPVVTWGSMTLADTGAGTASVALSGDQLLFARDAANPVVSFNPLITLGIAVSDTSEVAVSGNSAIASSAALVIGSGSGIGFNQGGTFHYGRLKLQNAFGDARRGVRANVELQKFTDRGWLRLSEDNTCLTVPVAAIAFSAGSGAFATDVCTAPATAAVALRQGRGTLVLPRTAGNVQGAALVTLDIGPTLEGNACAAGVPVTPTSAAWPHLLGARGSGTTQDQNPAARLVWGRQHRDYMVMRELF